MELGASEDGDGFVLSCPPWQASAHLLQLFIIEGSITIAFGLLVPFILADYPSGWVHCSLDDRNRTDLYPYSTKWLSERELHIAQGRLVKDVGLLDNPDEAERSGSGVVHGLKLAATDIKVWALA